MTNEEAAALLQDGMRRSPLLHEPGSLRVMEAMDMALRALRTPAPGAAAMREAAARVCRDIYDKCIATSKAAAREGLYGKENDQAMMASGAHACLLAIEAILAPEVPE